MGRAPQVTIEPAGGAATWNLTGQTLTIAVNGGAPVDVPVPAADPAQTTAAELAAAINASAAGVQAAVTGASQVTVTGRVSDTAPPTLAVASTPTAGAIVVATTTPGVVGVGPARLGGLRMTLSESISATAPPVLRALGFPGSARGYAADSPANPQVRPLTTTDGLRLVGGTDGNQAVVPADYEGDARERTGLHALDGVDVNLVALPGRNDVAFIGIAMAYCDVRGDCFCLVDGPGAGDRQVVIRPDDARQFVESLPTRSRNAAMFYPWIRVADPVGVGRNPTRFVPPSGHVAGIFARTDVTRGVWKAPAGIEATVPEAVGLQYQLLDAEQDLLNPVSLNCLRQFPGVGIVSWGTRTLSSDPEWRYVPVRRMGLFLKESLRRGLQWAVFEPNDEELWGRITINIRAFMMTLFRQGAFQGATPDEAFAVVCDRTTNPQENIDAGIVTARVAFAPLKPAEFVVIEISQKSLLVS
jgi:phage tail sheath protein FI